MIFSRRIGMRSSCGPERRSPAGGSRPTEAELEDGIPLFLQQLIQTLQSPCESMNNAMVETATIHGRNLLRMGFTVGQVVHDYGGLCQAITELAVSLSSSIST